MIIKETIIKKKYKCTKVAIDVLSYDESFLSIKRNKKYRKCFVCNTPFKLNDKVTIAMMEKIKNKCLCHKCGIEIQKKLEGINEKH